MRHDAIVIGGSFAGLSAAMYIARARRSVVVVDAGAPRNRFAEHSHGFFAQDGSEPRAMLATARSQVAAYPTATFVDGQAIGAARERTASRSSWRPARCSRAPVWCSPSASRTISRPSREWPNDGVAP